MERLVPTRDPEIAVRLDPSHRQDLLEQFAMLARDAGAAFEAVVRRQHMEQGGTA